ncbi:MAG TPA: nitrate reductase [Deltaproteobacteria bacterium]|nr:nitrate reductase [Deltaproteobacteria bacterium]
MRLLVCPPRYFRVDYVINPWMTEQIGRVDGELARKQWGELMESLSREASLLEIEPSACSPDMCFTANAGLAASDRVVPARFRMPERSREEGFFERWFVRSGFEVFRLPGDEAFEGEGDALFQPGDGLLWAGHGERSRHATHDELGRIFDVEVVSLGLVDSRFYHLDTCLAPLPGGRLIYYPGAFDEASKHAIESRIAPERRLAVEEDDAVGFACNLLRLGDRIFLNRASPKLRRALARWGFETFERPVGEFLKAGGGVKCLSMMLDQPET